MKKQYFILLHRLSCPVSDLIHGRPRYLLLAIIKMLIVRARRHLPDHRLMIPENLLIRKIHIIIADRIILRQRIVKRSIQMIVCSVDPDHIPCVTVLDAFLRICLRKRHNTPDSQFITEKFYCFGNALAYRNTVSKCPYDFMRILLLQFVILHIIDDKIMDEKLPAVLIHFLRLPRQLFYARQHRLPVLPDLVLRKKILRHKLHHRGIRIIPVGKFHRIKNLRAIHSNHKIDIRQFLIAQFQYREGILHFQQSLLHGIIYFFLFLVQLIVVIIICFCAHRTALQSSFQLSYPIDTK